VDELMGLDLKQAKLYHLKFHNISHKQKTTTVQLFQQTILWTEEVLLLG